MRITSLAPCIHRLRVQRKGGIPMIYMFDMATVFSGERDRGAGTAALDRDMAHGPHRTRGDPDAAGAGAQMVGRAPGRTVTARGGPRRGVEDGDHARTHYPHPTGGRRAVPARLCPVATTRLVGGITALWRWLRRLGPRRPARVADPSFAARMRQSRQWGIEQQRASHQAMRRHKQQPNVLEDAILAGKRGDHHE